MSEEPANEAHAPADEAGATREVAASGETQAAPALTPSALKTAYNAFKKRWKLTRLDQESRIGRGPMSSGQRSTIAGIMPPDQFPQEVWEELVRQGRLKSAGRGFYAMP